MHAEHSILNDKNWRGRREYFFILAGFKRYNQFRIEKLKFIFFTIQSYGCQHIYILVNNQSLKKKIITFGLQI